jgi:flavin reductase (DIM6/NTAB) family NADH-FMN oxidoreductase RutF/rubredoxin
MIDFEALFKISYGLYVVCSGDKDKGNGFISNTVFQLTAQPAKFAISCNKNNFTTGFIIDTGCFSVSVLHKDCPSEIYSRFGYKSGKDTDKLSGMDVKYGETGVPIVMNEAIAYLECKLVQTIDVGTHLLFIGELIQSVVLDNTREPVTYKYYREVKKGSSPKNAPTYIEPSKIKHDEGSTDARKYKCSACGYLYDEAEEKVKFADLPEDWCCPLCGVGKEDFMEL